MNVFGPSKAFLPLVFLDSFLLALLSLIFVFLPKFNYPNLVFLVFSLFFTMQGLFIVAVFRSGNLEIILNVIFIVICATFYFYQVFQFKKPNIIILVPLVMFLFSILFGFIQVPTFIILLCSGIGALTQIYILARPDFVSQLSLVTKRFYLLMTLQVFFDTLSFVFFRLNAPEVNIHY